MSNVNAAKLIIENIQLLEQSKKLLEDEISVELFEAVDEVIKNYMDAEWDGYYKFSEDYLAFAPSQWKVKDSNKFHQNYFARYTLNCENEETNGGYNHWWLSSFLKNDVDRIIFNFYPWQPNFAKCTTKDWKAFANEQNQLNPQIEQSGFKYNATSGGWYLAVNGIEPEIFIESYENGNLVDALTPISEALETIQKTNPYFDKIVQAAIAKFGRVEVEQTV